MKTVKLVCGKRVTYMAAGKVLEAIKDDIEAHNECVKEVFVDADIYKVEICPQKNYVKVSVKLAMAFEDVMKKVYA